MSSREGRDRRGAASWYRRPSLLIAATAIAVHFVAGVGPWLQYDRAAMAAGQFWRLGTCHLTHWSTDHLFWDALMLVALGTICEQMSWPDTRRCLLASGLVIPAAMWVLLPEMATYRGLSGIDSALFALLVGLLLKDKTQSWATVITVLVLAVAFSSKIGYEMITGATLFVDSGGVFTPIPLAHMAGGLVGIASAWGCSSRLFGSPRRLSVSFLSIPASNRCPEKARI